MDTILSAKLMTVENADPGTPEKIEITTEKIVTETRTYEKEFLLHQRDQITKDKEEYIVARDKELADIEELLGQFETLKGTPVEIIKEERTDGKV